ncbi:cobalamin-dependent protein [bacterium]|nr:cobalamin-dependent protein [candidate division CSSED10-310 bacterium]
MVNPVIWMIRPWIEDFSAFDHFAQPVGFLRIAAVLSAIGFQVNYLDCLDTSGPDESSGFRISPGGPCEYRSNTIAKPEVFKFVPRFYKRYGSTTERFETAVEMLPKPGAVLITTAMTYWYSGVARVIETVRRAAPGAPVIVGGIYATLCPEHMQSVLKPDMGIPGPVDEPFYRRLCDLTGVKFPRKMIDLHPPPCWNHVPGLRYGLISMRTGCSRNCTYCAAGILSGPPRDTPISGLIREIDTILKQPGIRNIALYDDDLGAMDPDRLADILRFLAGQYETVSWHLPNAVSAHAITPRIAGLLRRAGFVQPRLSFPHIDRKLGPEGLNDATVNQLSSAAGHLIRAGYAPDTLSAYIPAGLPGQRLSWLERAGGQMLRCGIKPFLAQYSPVPGTAIGSKRLSDLEFDPSHPEPLLTNKILSVYRHPGWTFKQYYDLANHWRSTRVS